MNVRKSLGSSRHFSVVVSTLLASLALVTLLLGLKNVAIIDAAGTACYLGDAAGNDIDNCNSLSAPLESVSYTPTRSVAGDAVRVDQDSKSFSLNAFPRARVFSSVLAPTLTPFATVLPFEPPILRHTDPITDRVSVRWEAVTIPGTTITSYSLRYRFNGGAWEEWADFPGATTEAEFILPNEEDGVYDFEVIATNSAGEIEPWVGVPEASILVDIYPPYFQDPYVTVNGLYKDVGCGSSQYTVENLGAGEATTVHEFYDEGGSPLASFANTIPAGESKVYGLTDIAGLPADYTGYVLISADQEIEGYLGPVAQYHTVRYLQKAEGGSSRYSVSSQCSHLVTYMVQEFYDNDDFVVTSLFGQLSAGATEIYDLATIDDIPYGYEGYVIISSDQPITVTMLSNADLELAQRFSPQLYRHSEELYWPIYVQPPVNVARLYYPGGDLLYPTLNQLSQNPFNNSESFLDFPCKDSHGWTNYFCNGQKEGAANYWDGVKNGADWRPRIFAHVEHPAGHITIQYWFFYYHNPGIDIDVIGYDNHEGDWEMVQVVLDSAETPLYAVYAQHGYSSRRPWEDVDKTGTHPHVYYAKGSHASYFKPYTYRVIISGTTIPLINDYTGTEDVDSSELILLSGSEPWLGFIGRWGLFRDDWTPHNDGPVGPSQNDRWSDPMGWAENSPWDELSDHNANKFTCSISYPGDVHVYDNTTGDHSGRLPNGVVEEEIPGSEYIDNHLAQQQRRTVLLHQPASPSWLRYRCEVTYAEGVITADSSPSMNSSVPISLTVNAPDYEANKVTNVVFANMLLPISATAVVSATSPSDFSLLVDADSDGETDYTVAPTTAETMDVDFTSPDAINDLVAVSDKPGRVELMWTATGDDGSTGTAAAYEIRYSTEMITQVNWTDAIQILDPPSPAPAGLHESFVLTGLPVGKLYFGMQVVDDALQSSELSNIPGVDVPPYHNNYLPVILKGH